MIIVNYTIDNLTNVAKTPDYMGTRRHGQEGHMLPSPHSGNVVKCFCALVVTTKRSIDELFMQYFHSLWSASGDFARRPHQNPSLDPAGDFRPQTSNLPTPGKNPADAKA